MGARKRFNLLGFVRAYIHEVMRLADEKCYYFDCDIPFSEFEEIVFGEVSSQLGISIEMVNYLHHSLHWALFCSKNGSSPVRQIQNLEIGKGGFYFGVFPSYRGDFSKSEERLVKKVMKEHGKYLKERLKSFTQAAA